MEEVPTKPHAGRRGQRARISWGRGARRLLLTLLASLLTIAGLAGASPSVATAAKSVRIIVRTTPGGGAAAKRSLASAGGTFRLRLKILHGFSATLPASSIAAFSTAPGVLR